ncbi:MAG: hypothetical protein J07HX64_00539 [halophilic archaeon J07HX64]|jgi:hypothetical protein|nr:MAG: hypothetical protein J07HX64_00539 [halophilic archaeon J07HX64]
MTRVSPYYFDNELISANIQGVSRGDRPEYVFEVNINDDRIKERVSNRLADYETDVERWHVNTQKETESAELVEGVAVADGDDGVNADTT